MMNLKVPKYWRTRNFLLWKSASEDESQLEIERLRKKLVELEADQRSRNPLKEKRSQFETRDGDPLHVEST